jgi:cytochrome c peroxidase
VIASASPRPIRLVVLARVLALAALVALSSAPSACSSRDVAAAPSEIDPAYPAGPYGVAEGQVLPDLGFDGVTDSGAPGRVRLRDAFAPHIEGASLLLIAVHGGLWCGTCRWYGAHAGEIVARAGGDAIRRLDLVIGDRDNAPARVEDARAWRDVFALGASAVAADPSASLLAAMPARGGALPLFLGVDRRSMKVTSALANPTPEALEARLAVDLAALDGRAAPAPPKEDLVDGLFHRNEWDVLAETTLPGAPPADPTNAVADAPAAAELGEALFHDAALSPANLSCASCHDARRHLSDGLPVADGAASGDRRTPAIALAAHARWQFWDGRAETLWAQALGPFESPTELASSRVFVARRVAERHRDAYARAFPGERLPDTARWPVAGKPGDPAYEAMTAGEKEDATAVFVRGGKAIAAYERTFRVGPSALDAYLGGERSALAPLEKYGLVLFARTGCQQCHWGPRLTDDAFHDTGSATGRRDHLPDRGRADGLSLLRTSEFRASGRWSDDPSAARPERLEAGPESLAGKMKTPPLRGVADLDHFGHGGTLSSLAAVTEAYGRGTKGAREPWITTFGETVQWGLVPFLWTLHADVRGAGAAAQ